MAFASVAAVVVAAVVTAVTTWQASEAQARRDEYNAKVQKQMAERAQMAAEARAQAQERQDERIQHALRARAAGAGLEEDAGSSLLAQMENAEEAALNAKTIRWSGEARASDFLAGRRLSMFQAQQAREGGYIGAGTALLTGGARAYARYNYPGSGLGYGSARAQDADPYGVGYPY